MSHIANRLFKDDADIQVILDLIARVRPPEHRNVYPVKVDIEESFASEVVRANTRLWFDDDQPIAWTFVDSYNNLQWELDNKYQEVLGAEIVEWGEACIRKTLAAKGPATLDASCSEGYRERISFLKRNAFMQTRDTTVYMMRPLSEPISEPKLPQGFLVRPIAGKSEAEAVAAMHRAAFGTEYMTTENRLVIMNTSEYDPSLDLLVIAPDGMIAANCIGSVNEREKRGFTDPVSTHPQFQRLGLSRALLLTGLRLLKERGMSSAHLGTSGDNTAMQKTARSVGFKVEYRTIWFSKEVH